MTPAAKGAAMARAAARPSGGTSARAVSIKSTIRDAVFRTPAYLRIASAVP